MFATFFAARRMYQFAAAGILRWAQTPALLALAGAALLAAPAARASDRPPSESDYQIATWNTAQGLPHSSVQALAQTPDGSIWCGTELGLAQFDGVHFTVFDSQTTPELGGAQIRSLFTDASGALWISTRDARLVRFQNGVFKAYFPPRGSSLGQVILNMAEDDRGALWLMTEDVTATRFVGGVFDESISPWPDGPKLFNIRQGLNRSIWMSSWDHLVNLDHGVIKTVLSGVTNQYGFHSPSRTGGYWVSDESALGICRDGQWLWRGGKAPPWKSSLSLRWGVEDTRSRLWLATYGEGVYCCDTNGTSLHFDTSNGLSSDYALFLLPDRENNIWVATENGLSRIKPALFEVYGHRQGFMSDRITGTCAAPNGDLWVGTDGAGLYRLRDGTASAVTNDPSMPLITSVLVNGDSNVWAGTRGFGALYHSSGQGFVLVSTPSQTTETSALFKDSKGGLWIGQRTLGSVLEALTNLTGRLIRLPSPEPVTDVRCFAEDASGVVWIGTAGAGLFSWDGKNCKRFSRNDGLPSDSIWSLMFDREDGSLWIGTCGGGLARLKQGQFAACGVSHGLWNDTICEILEDDLGWFWFGSRNGVFRVRKQVLREFMDGDLQRIHSTAYGVEDGLPSLACSGGFQPAGCRTADGRLWFPTLQGLVSIDPRSVPASPHPPVVQIKRVLLNGDELRDAPAHRDAASDVPVLRIPPGARRYEFQYTGLSFAAPEAIQFRYRLEGLDTDWIEAGTLRSAIYSRLPPGNYRFLLKAANRDGVWSDEQAMLRLQVLPAFWQTGWFIAGCIAVGGGLFGGVGWLVARERTRKRLAELAQAQALERERARIARDMHDDLGARLTGLANLGELAMSGEQSPAGVKSQLQFLTGRVRELINAVDEAVWTVSPENDSLPNLAAFLCDYTERFVSPSGIAHRLELDAEFPPVPLTAEARHNLLLAAKESLNNAVRHAAPKTIRLKIHFDGGWLKVVVEDDGRGFDVPSARADRHGLSNLAQRMAMVNGRAEIVSEAGKGTTVTLAMPLADDSIRS